ncbi:MAG: metallophosphoesterase family protein [Candidatus Omnitrophica bacterium]|nr:metallophosphoesterase family protein [Candidatus Omnitrophota bacterium]
MRYGIFSDIHANLEAFQAVLEALSSEKIDTYLFLGDVVGYGADPAACIAVLERLCKEHPCMCIAGNHDRAACGMTSIEQFNIHARIAAEWTRDQLGGDDLAYLERLELVKHCDDCSIVHSTLKAPAEWGYIFDIDDADENVKLLERQVCFIGHSHQPLVFAADEMVDCFKTERLELRHSNKYIVNVGSVGQPRDGDARASYAVFDTAKRVIEIRRVEYDVAKAQSKIMKAGLPRILSERLSRGK